MKCPKCNNEAKDQLIQYQYKEYTNLFFVLMIIGIMALFAGMVLGIIGLQSPDNTDQAAESVLELVIAKNLLSYGGLLTFVTLITRVLEPYKSKNVLTFLCPSCGHAWRSNDIEY